MRRALLALSLALGCMPRIEPINVRVAHVGIARMEAADVRILIINPNRFALDLEDLHYCLLLTTDTIAAGANSTSVHIGARDTTETEFRMALRIGLADAARHLASARADTFRIRLTGRYALPTFLGPLRRPFSYENAIPLSNPLERLFGPFVRQRQQTATAPND